MHTTPRIAAHVTPQSFFRFSSAQLSTLIVAVAQFIHSSEKEIRKEFEKKIFEKQKKTTEKKKNIILLNSLPTPA